MLAQRWNQGRESYRPAAEPIETSQYDVASIDDDSTARDFVVKHHYSASYPAARFRFGLYRRGNLVGVAVYSQPMSNKVITGSLGIASHQDGAELGRFVLLDDVPANGESWFIAQTFRGLRREGLAGVVSFSDPSRRMSSAGVQVFAGHVGVIYQATNARYVGRGTARTLKLLPDGRVFSPRAMQKIRSGERGVSYAVGQLVRAGAERPTDREDMRDWLRHWTGQLCRNVRHRGNHKYIWAFHRGLSLPDALPYPKQVDA